MDIIVKGHEYFYDITSMSMLFFPGEKAEFVDKSRKSVYIRSVVKSSDNKQISHTKIKYDGRFFSSQKTISAGRDVKEAVKYTFYKACSKATDITSPWGTLTGIRPLSVYERFLSCGENVDSVLKNRFLVSHDKINILKEISDCQHNFISHDKRDVSIYVSVPFCPSKCTYCSFISISALNKSKLQSEYVTLLLDEIKLKAELVKKYSLNVKSLYIGGGTPGVLTVNELQTLLSCLDEFFDLHTIPETCFEMGRPDTVSEDKLTLLKKYGFDRICINTQTTNDDILKKVNRKHGYNDFSNAVALTKSFGFKSINTDIIAGLPGEDLESFKKTVTDVIATGVDNITVHTLAIKRSATLAQSDEYYDPQNPEVDKMVDFAYHTLKRDGYIPYYIYRQKNCVSNGENIGFCKPTSPCLYNIYMMEDIHSVIACGAGASSKIVNGTDVNRVINVKYPMDYVIDFNKIINNLKKTEELLKVVFFNE